MYDTRSHVLLVEDDRYVAGTLAWVLQTLPLEVTAVTSGNQAFAAIRRRPFALLLIDRQLPDFSGLDFVRRLRAEGRACPFIIVGESMTDAFKTEAFELGALTLVDKPPDIDRLLHVVIRALWGTSMDGQGERNGNGHSPHEPNGHIGRIANVLPAALGARPSVERVAACIMAAATCPRDPKTTDEWARYVGASAGAVRGYCRLARLQARDARDVARVLRALFQSGDRWLPETKLECAELRTLKNMMEHAGLAGRTGGATPTIEEFLDRQRWIPQDHPVLVALRGLLR